MLRCIGRLVPDLQFAKCRIKARDLVFEIVDADFKANALTAIEKLIRLMQWKNDLKDDVKDGVAQPA